MSIDLDFRPASYSDFDGPVALALNGINGQMRRTMVRDMLTREGEEQQAYELLLGPIDSELLEERPEAGRINAVNSWLGPSWMGGEYLPLRKRGEVEIARVVLQSTTMDVFSLRARWSGGRYHYRLVDEYQSDFLLCRKTSKRTLSLRQIIEVLDTVGGGIETGHRGVVTRWWNQQWGHGYSPEECVAFAWVESEQYPGLPAWYEERAKAWMQERAESTEEDAE